MKEINASLRQKWNIKEDEDSDMRFKTNIKFWRGILNAASGLIDEGSFNATENGLALRAMDPSHVAMIELSLPKGLFEEYECMSQTKFAVTISELLKLLRGIGIGESIDLLLDEQTRKLTVDAMGRYRRTFKLSTLEVTGEEAPAPKLSFNAKVKMLTTALDQAIADASKVSDYAKFAATADKFTMEASGDVGSAVIEFQKGSEALLDLTVQQESIAAFSLVYMNTMVSGASDLSDVITIEFSTNLPLRLDFDLPSEGYLRFYLAPRIESE